MQQGNRLLPMKVMLLDGKSNGWGLQKLSNTDKARFGKTTHALGIRKNSIQLHDVPR